MFISAEEKFKALIAKKRPIHLEENAISGPITATSCYVNASSYSVINDNVGQMLPVKKHDDIKPIKKRGDYGKQG